MNITTVQKEITLTADTFPQPPDFTFTAVCDVFGRDVTIHTIATDTTIEQTLDAWWLLYRPLMRRYIGGEIFGMEADPYVVNELRQMARRKDLEEKATAEEAEGERQMQDIFDRR